MFLTLDAIGAPAVRLDPESPASVVVCVHAFNPSSELISPDEQSLGCRRSKDRSHLFDRDIMLSESWRLRLLGLRDIWRRWSVEAFFVGGSNFGLPPFLRSLVHFAVCSPLPQMIREVSAHLPLDCRQNIPRKRVRAGALAVPGISHCSQPKMRRLGPS